MAEQPNIIAAFSADQVTKLTGLTKSQLAFWDKTSFFPPQYASENRRSAYSRIYSFEDLVGLRTLSILMNGHHVPMAHLKDVAHKLSRYTARPWSDIKLMVWKRKVQWIEPDTGLPAGIVDGQYLMIEIANIVEDMKSAVQKERERDPAEIGKISRRKFIAHNQAVIAGTRIPVGAIQRFLKAGYSSDEIIKEYPTLTESDVKAALSFREPKAVA